MGIWPKALYGSEAHPLAKTQVSKLRRAAANAIIGPRAFANSQLALTTASKYATDPLTSH